MQSLAKHYRSFGVVWMNRQVMEILMTVSRFYIEICNNLTVFDTNFKVKKCNAFFAWLISKFDVRMELNSFQLSSCSLCVQMKKISSIYLNHTKGCNSWVSKKKNSLNFIHKQTRIGWGKLGTNSGTRNLLLNLSVKLEVVILQNKICHPYQFTSRNSVLFSLIKYFPKSF